MPRKSAAALAAEALTNALDHEHGARLEPSERLTTAHERAAFREIVGSKPADFYTSGDVPMIEACARAVVADRVLGVQLTEAGTAAALAARGGLRRYAWLLSLQQNQGRHLAMLMTRLRCTPQSRYTPRQAAAKPASKRPWQE